MSKIALIDPLTLLGREIANEFRRRRPDGGELVYFHTSDDDEIQVAQIGGHAAMVPPLATAGDLEFCDAVILSADKASDRLEILDRILEDSPDLLFLDASPLGRYRHLTHPAADADGQAFGNRLHLAHPSIVVARALTDALSGLGPVAASIAAIEPVSVFGKKAVETLAHQAAHRLQGETVKELLDGQVLAFNLGLHGGADLTSEAALLLPELDVAATRTMGGCFHGHLTLLSLVFSEPAKADDVTAALENASNVTIVEPPLNLDTVTDRSDIVVTPPALSEDGRLVALQAATDGTLVGGALTAVTIFQGLM